MIARAWHVIVLRHWLTRTRVTTPMWDPSARGVYVECSCGRAWAY